MSKTINLEDKSKQNEIVKIVRKQYCISPDACDIALAVFNRSAYYKKNSMDFMWGLNAVVTYGILLGVQQERSRRANTQ